MATWVLMRLAVNLLKKQEMSFIFSNKNKHGIVNLFVNRKGLQVHSNFKRKNKKWKQIIYNHAIERRKQLLKYFKLVESSENFKSNHYLTIQAYEKHKIQYDLLRLLMKKVKAK